MALSFGALINRGKYNLSDDTTNWGGHGGLKGIDKIKMSIEPKKKHI